MANINLYATLAEYKAYSVARGQTTSTDATDDGVIVDLLEAASRFIDDKTVRQFYPTIETRLYDVPQDEELWLDQDLLEVTTLTNGDLSVVTDYNMLPANMYPKYMIRLKDTANVQWEADSDGELEQVISVLGVWGYRDKYNQRAWQSVGTLAAAITDTTTLAFSATTGHSITAGMILKINSEYYNVVTAAANTITPIARGDNGSTAATHLISTAIYAFKPQEEARNAVLEIANNAYNRRFGKAVGESATITAAGVVLSPRDIPAMASEFINNMRRLV